MNPANRFAVRRDPEFAAALREFEQRPPRGDESWAQPAPEPEPAGPEIETSGWPKPLAVEAYHGLAGEIVGVIEPHSEADPAAILLQALTCFGNAIGRSPHFVVEADRHGLNLFVVLVGETSKGRKGVSFGRARELLQSADEGWSKSRIASGLSSGEGLIYQVRDPIMKREPIREHGRVTAYQEIEADPGEPDKRLLIFEPELALVLRVMAREGSNLSALIRQAWDSGELRTLTKNSPIRATGAHISIAAHVTRGELLRYLDSTEAANGFGNRFLWACVSRSKCLPDDEQRRIDERDINRLRARLTDTVKFAAGVGEMTKDDEAREDWRAVYPALSEGKPGMLGAVTSRAEAQTMRLACLYSLLDNSSVIRREHLRAALAVWSYCEQSAAFIFGQILGDPLADEILQSLRRGSAGMTRTEISNLSGRHKNAAQIGRAISALREAGRARCDLEQTGGRSAERWYAV